MPTGNPVKVWFNMGALRRSDEQRSRGGRGRGRTSQLVLLAAGPGKVAVSGG